ncbi:MAG: acyl-CoA dehydrogenase [Haliea sp.]|nr:acyl-CoA dehydrogenase [Haliea sp.]|tara:strand:+ start:2188 stop:3348 length:1161 start_codon:yes stop_codon:yes gene_type:complete
MDLGFSEEQMMLRDMTRKICDEMMPLTVLREYEGTEPGYSTAFWLQLGALGLTGIAIEEKYDGMGLGAIESSIVAEEFGRALAVSPYLVSSVLAAGLIENAGTEHQKGAWLGQIARGTTACSVAVSEPGNGADKEGVTASITRVEGNLVLSGVKHLVPFAASADILLVLARLEGGSGEVVAIVLERALLDSGLADGTVTMAYQRNHAGDPLYRIRFECLQLPPGQLLGDGRCVWSSWEQAMARHMLSVASYAIGAAQRVQGISVEYAKYRRAFGRAIGGFQSIAHYLAEMEVAIEGARTLVYEAAWCSDESRPYRHLAAMAKLQACDVFCRVAAVAIQVHGGLGYTIEADPQLFYRRAKQMELTHWGPDSLERQIAEHLFAERVCA